MTRKEISKYQIVFDNSGTLLTLNNPEIIFTLYYNKELIATYYAIIEDITEEKDENYVTDLALRSYGLIPTDIIINKQDPVCFIVEAALKGSTFITDKTDLKKAFGLSSRDMSNQLHATLLQIYPEKVVPINAKTGEYYSIKESLEWNFFDTVDVPMENSINI